MRVFVHKYASEVAEVVLIESLNPRQLPQSSTNVQSHTNQRWTQLRYNVSNFRACFLGTAIKAFGLLDGQEEMECAVVVGTGTADFGNGGWKTIPIFCSEASQGQLEFGWIDLVEQSVLLTLSYVLGSRTAPSLSLLYSGGKV